MSQRKMITGVLATALVAFALAGAGCKKEEKAKEGAPAAAQQASVQAVAAHTFDNSTDGWTARGKNIKLEPASSQKHAGNASLKISGAAESGLWNFAASSKINLEPGKKYKISGWMLVESWDKVNYPPLLKYAVYKDNKWVSNAFTAKYDLKKSKEWQRILTVFETPQDGAINGFVSLEKGTQDPINAVVYLDDIKIEPSK